MEKKNNNFHVEGHVCLFSKQVQISLGHANLVGKPLIEQFEKLESLATKNFKVSQYAITLQVASCFAIIPFFRNNGLSER